VVNAGEMFFVPFTVLPRLGVVGLDEDRHLRGQLHPADAYVLLVTAGDGVLRLVGLGLQ
jgi:hypothetical protein